MTVKEKFFSSLNSTAGGTGHLKGQGEGLWFQDKNLFEMASLVIRILLSVVGILFLLWLIYGGYLWMTDMGNEDQVKKAKNIIRNSAIGLIVILCAYAITTIIQSLI